MASVAAACGDRDFSQTAIADAAPIGEGSGVQHGTFKRSLLLEAGPDAKNLADVSGDGVQVAGLGTDIRSAAKARHLGRRSIQQERAYGVGIQPMDLAAISG